MYDNGHVGAIGHDLAIVGVNRPLQGGQDQVDVPQLPLLTHEDEIETPNWACKGYWP